VLARPGVVIGGFIEPADTPVGFGVLLRRYDGGDRLRWRVGTGFHHRALLGLRTRFDELSTSEPPFADHVRETRPHWVEPAVVARIAFIEWTRDGMSRHPRSLGPRDDKAARDVVRERPSGLTAR
jgi:bifunctional non-homologous end joining protein LigD